MQRTNVAQFIKEHGIGKRHYQDKSRDFAAGTSHTTAGETLNPGMSDNTSWFGGKPIATPSDKMFQTGPSVASRQQSIPKNSMLTLSFKKVLS